MYDYIQNDIIETTVTICVTIFYSFCLLSNDVWMFAEQITLGNIYTFDEDDDEIEDSTTPTAIDCGEVGEVGWDHEYEDCLTSLYRYLFEESSANTTPPLQQSPPVQVPPVPYHEKYDATWKKRMSTPVTPKDRLSSLFLSTLKNNVLFETTPFGNVIMYYDTNKESFIYYSDKTLSYPIVNAVGKKYVLTFGCEGLYQDTDTPTSTAAVSPEETQPPPPTVTVTESPKEPTKSVFAKFKNYKNPSTAKAPGGPRPPYKNAAASPVVEPQQMDPPKNRYTCEGKLANYSFLQKVAKVKPLSYKDFKLRLKG